MYKTQKELMAAFSYYEKKQIEQRNFNHWLHNVQIYGHSTWNSYWKANKKYCFQNAMQFKQLLSEKMWNRYLNEWEVNPWTLHNIETMNG